MLKIKDIVNKISKDQFIVKELFKDSKPFSITESTPKTNKYKTLCIDFGEDICRFVSLDNLILILKEMYGKDYLVKAINEIKPYDEIKDIVVSDKIFEQI